MKKLALLAVSLLLVGQGCKVGQQAEFKAQVPPAAQPATPPTEPGEKAQPATPPSDAIKAEIDANAGADVMAKLEAKVTITAGGTFSPATLTVKKGTAVTWTNVGNLPVWPASGPHPVHTDYPGFDAKTDLRNGESYSFTFDKTGSWSYHNHLNPTAGGTIIVE